jgi:hypothetical protein
MSIVDIQNAFVATQAHVLLCASGVINPGTELKLIADPVLSWISTSGGPLTADVLHPTAPCDPSKNAVEQAVPSNIPPGLKYKKKLPTPADILGIYEGGGHFDCGVFRPAGRCKMRSGNNKVIPFCQVCRYLIVDRVDSTKLNDWDKRYDPFYPT